MPSLPKPPECSLCPLESNGFGYVPAFGTGVSGVMIVGEAPGEPENREGRPFVESAPAGAILERTIKRLGMDRSQHAVMHTIQCRPSRTNYLEHAPYEMDAVNHCRVHMDQEVKKLQPKVMFALGNVALRTLTGFTGKKRGIANVRGFYLDNIRYPGVPVIASYHPALIARGKPNLLGVLRTDLLRAQLLAKAGGVFARPTKNYWAFPTIEEAWRWVEELRKHPEDLITYDIETVESIAGVDESELRAAGDGKVERTTVREEYQDVPAHLLPEDIEPEDLLTTETTRTQITQIQFCHRYGEALILPFHGEFIDVAMVILNLPNPKGDWNGRIFDRPLLREAGIVPKGVVYDFMDAWHHLQADLPKGLQYVTSFFVPEAEPWKHLADSDAGRYGGDDVMYLRQFGPTILQRLKDEGLWYGYDRQVRELGEVFTAASERGIPVDDVRRRALGEEVSTAQKLVNVEIQDRVPDVLRNVEPKQGYKNPGIAWKKIKEVGHGLGVGTGEKWAIRDFRTGETIRLGPNDFRESIDNPQGVDYVRQRTPGENDASGSMVASHLVAGWKICRIQPFLPNGSQQILRWIKWRREQDIVERMAKYATMPRYAALDPMGEGKFSLRGLAERTTLWKIPKKLKEDKETTAKVELERLAKATGDDFLLKIIEYREYGKINSTYVKGWAPGPDGFIHPTFKFGPATGQMSSSGPNCQNGPAPKGPEGSRPRRIAEAFRGMIMAKPSYRIVTFDYKAFHVLTTGFEAKAPTWMRLARRDMHSFVTGMFIGEPWERWLDMEDEELDEVLKLIKGQKTARYQELGTKFIRDRKAKPAGLAVGFAAQEKKIYDLNREAFASIAEVKTLFRHLDRLDPRIRQWHREVRVEAYEINKGFLKTKFGYMRWFHDIYHWDSRRGTMGPGEDHEAVVAYRPANDAFGIKKDVLLWLRDNELDGKFGFSNDIHDELWFHCPEAHVEECVDRVYHRMIEPNDKLVDPVLAPVGLWCEAEPSVGISWREMEEIKMGKAGIKRILEREVAARAELVGVGR